MVLDLPDKESLKKISVASITSGGLAGALIGVPVLAQSSGTTGATATTDITSQISGLGGIVTAAATIAGAPIVIWFGYRIFKRVVSSGT